MPDFFEEVFSYCGESLKDYLDLRALDVHYKIFYPDSSYLSVYHDSERTKEDLEKIEKIHQEGDYWQKVETHNLPLVKKIKIRTRKKKMPK